MKPVVFIAALATLPPAVDALDLTGLPAALTNKVTVARAWEPEAKLWRSVDARIEQRRLCRGTWYATCPSRVDLLKRQAGPDVVRLTSFS